MSGAGGSAVKSGAGGSSDITEAQLLYTWIPRLSMTISFTPEEQLQFKAVLSHLRRDSEYDAARSPRAAGAPAKRVQITKTGVSTEITSILEGQLKPAWARIVKALEREAKSPINIASIVALFYEEGGYHKFHNDKAVEGDDKGKVFVSWTWKKGENLDVPHVLLFSLHRYSADPAEFLDWPADMTAIPTVKREYRDLIAVLSVPPGDALWVDGSLPKSLVDLVIFVIFVIA